MLVPVLDRPSADDPQTLEEVEQAIATGAVRLRFCQMLERRYQNDTLEPRRHFLHAVGISGLLIYNLYLLCDWLILRDVFVYLLIGRLGLYTPTMIGVLALSQRVSTRWALETLGALGTVLSTFVPMVVMVHSDSPYRLNYQMGTLLIMVFCTMILQTPFRYAVVAIFGIAGNLLLITYWADFSEFAVWQVNAVLMVSTGILLLMGSYFLERNSRMSYLFALRGRLLEVQLKDIARTDPLTQLFNRRYQGEVMNIIWERAAQTPTRVAVILLDIDHFKSYNDNYGHPEGDTCLKRLSQVIQRTAQAVGALAFRFGGEEMLVLMVNPGAGQAEALAERLRTAVYELAVPHPVLGQGARVTISLGIAAGTAPQATADMIVASADNALYAAKHAGRNCLRCARLEAVNG
jgi:diguanylate cyclase (GGDEF)-like protein